MMRARRLIVVAGLLVVGAVAGAARVAGARGEGLTCGTAALTVTTVEPKTGFTGACLVPFLTYTAQVPTVCYSPPANSTTYSLGRTTCSAPAQSVQYSYSGLPATFDSYRVLLTCYPHADPGVCPPGSFFTGAHSCCDYGSNMTSLDGATASGLVNFVTSP